MEVCETSASCAVVHSVTDIYSSTGVQIGGPKSAMGVAGVWTTTHHDQGLWLLVNKFITLR